MNKKIVIECKFYTWTDTVNVPSAKMMGRPTDLPEIIVQGYGGFLFRDKNGMPEVAMHWQNRFNHAVKNRNENEAMNLQKRTSPSHIS